MLPFVQVRYRYRLNPTPGQRIALSRAFGARVVFNDGLRLREQARLAGEKYVSNGAVQKAVITAAKKTPERAWLGEVSSVVLVQAVNDLHRAYRNFFDSAAGKRKGRKMGAPRFRSKRGRQSIRLTREGFQLRPSGRLYVAKVGGIPVRWSRQLPSVPSSVTVLLDPAGRYWASFVVEVAQAPLPAVEREVGVDLGLTHLATRSDGRKVDNPRWLRSKQRHLGRAQRAMCRKQKGSNNRKKAVRKLARLHARVADARRDHLHKLSTTWIRDKPSGLRRGSMRRRVGPQQAGPVDLRRWLVHVRWDAQLQGQTVRPALRKDRPLVPLHPHVLRLRAGEEEVAAERAEVDLPVRQHPRPGREGGQENSRGGMRREGKRLWRRRKTTTCGGCCR
jgi:putative transposase